MRGAYICEGGGRLIHGGAFFRNFTVFISKRFLYIGFQ